MLHPSPCTITTIGSMPILRKHPLDPETPIHIIRFDNELILQPSVIDVRYELDHDGSSRFSIPFQNSVIWIDDELRKFFQKIGSVLGAWLGCVCKLETHASGLVNLWCLYYDCIIDLWLIDSDLTLNTVLLPFLTDQYKVVFLLLYWFHGTILDL